MTDKQPIAIIGAMPQEITTLTQQLDDPQQITIGDMTFYTGVLAGQAVVITQCGIGKVNATIATTLVIHSFSPSAVINTGSAGGIGEGLAVGDVVIGNAVAHHDVDVTAFGYAMGQMAQMPADYACDETLVTRASQCAKAFPNATIHRGQIVSGDQFICSAERFATIKQHFPQALAVEMEACAIAQTCYRFDTPFVVIRAISDLANEKASVSFDEFIVEAGKRSAEMVIAMIR